MIVCKGIWCKWNNRLFFLGLYYLLVVLNDLIAGGKGTIAGSVNGRKIRIDKIAFIRLVILIKILVKIDKGVCCGVSKKIRKQSAEIRICFSLS